MTMFFVREPDETTGHRIIFNCVDIETAREFAAAKLGLIVHTTTEELVKELYPCPACKIDGVDGHVMRVQTRR